MDVDVLPARLAPDGERSGDVPVLATGAAEVASTGNVTPPAVEDVPANDAQPRTPTAGTGNIAPLPAGLVLDELPVLAHGNKPVASTGKQGPGWRVERFGPPAQDGRGRYWQWRKGSKKRRQSAYGGKVSVENSDYWQHRNTNPHGHDPRRD